MADRDHEIARLEARIAALEARPSAGDLDWLKTSNVWKRAEIAANPRFVRANAYIVGGGFAAFFITIIIGCLR